MAFLRFLHLPLAYFTSRGMLDGSPTSATNTLLGLFSNRTPVNGAAPDLSMQPAPPHDHEDNRAPINDPEAGAEISLAKRHGTHIIILFLQLSC